jgi:hypothetical protein
VSVETSMGGGQARLGRANAADRSFAHAAGPVGVIGPRRP